MKVGAAALFAAGQSSTKVISIVFYNSTFYLPAGDGLLSPVFPSQVRLPSVLRGHSAMPSHWFSDSFCRSFEYFTPAIYSRGVNVFLSGRYQQFHRQQLQLTAYTFKTSIIKNGFEILYASFDYRFLKPKLLMFGEASVCKIKPPHNCSLALKGR